MIPADCPAIPAAAAAGRAAAPRPLLGRWLEPRFHIVLACFLATVTIYVERVGFSIAFTAMASKVTGSAGSDARSEQPSRFRELDLWTARSLWALQPLPVLAFLCRRVWKKASRVPCCRRSTGATPFRRRVRAGAACLHPILLRVLPCSPSLPCDITRGCGWYGGQPRQYRHSTLPPLPLHGRSRAAGRRSALAASGC